MWWSTNQVFDKSSRTSGSCASELLWMALALLTTLPSRMSLRSLKWSLLLLSLLSFLVMWYFSLPPYNVIERNKPPRPRSPGSRHTALGRPHPGPTPPPPAPRAPELHQASRPPGSAAQPAEPPPSGASPLRLLRVPAPRPLRSRDALRASLPGSAGGRADREALRKRRRRQGRGGPGLRLPQL